MKKLSEKNIQEKHGNILILKQISLWETENGKMFKKVAEKISMPNGENKYIDYPFEQIDEGMTHRVNESFTKIVDEMQKEQQIKPATKQSELVNQTENQSSGFLTFIALICCIMFPPVGIIVLLSCLVQSSENKEIQDSTKFFKEHPFVSGIMIGAAQNILKKN